VRSGYGPSEADTGRREVVVVWWEIWDDEHLLWRMLLMDAQRKIAFMMEHGRGIAV
jgi:hypothetical protein